MSQSSPRIVPGTAYRVWALGIFSMPVSHYSHVWRMSTSPRLERPGFSILGEVVAIEEHCILAGE